MSNSQLKNEEQTSAPSRQAEDTEAEKRRVLDLVRADKERRDQGYRYFRYTNLATYTDASMDQFIGYRKKPAYKKDYQYNVFDPITRDKVMAIISKSAGLYEAQFFSKNKQHAKHSALVSSVLGAFYQDSTEKLNEKDENKLTMLAALIRPKVIWYEGWRYQQRTVRDIEERDEKTGEPTKYKERKIVHYNGPWGQRCHVLDIIPGSIRIRNLQEQPRFTWVPKMQHGEFKRMYGKYPGAKNVQAKGALASNDQDSLIRNDLKENEVEVVMFFEKWDDRLTIIANGVMLTKPGSPMPFSHKDYPFVWGGFEPLDDEFIYDMPLPMKLLDMQDMSNEVLNLTLDMIWRALQEVYLVANGDSINDDVLYGGGFADVDDPKNFQQLQFGNSFAFNGAQNLRDVARRSIEGSSLDAPSSGQTGTRDITAREVLAAREAALEITTLFLDTMEAMEKGKARLRVLNQLDRYKRPIEWQKSIGEDLAGAAIPVFRELSVRNAKLSNGKRGTMNVAITEKPRPPQELDKLNVENDQELSQTIDLTPDFIRDILFDVEIAAGSAVKKTKSQQVGEARAFLNDAAALPQVFNVGYAAKEYVKTLGKKEDEALVQAPEGGEDPLAQMMAQFGGGGGAPGASQKPRPAPKEFAPDSMESILNAQL